MAELFPISLAEQIECVDRELKMRARVYPLHMAAGKMTEKLAERETTRMQAVLETLRYLATKES